jgi:hypothetical protein
MKNLLTIPRIIGIVLLILAALAFRTQGMLRTALLAIAGLILALTPNAEARKHWQDFLASFKVGKDFALVMLFDALFWAAFAILVLVLAQALRAPFAQLGTIPTTQLTLGTVGAAVETIDYFFTYTIVAIVIFWLALILAYSASRGLIWLALLGKPVQVKFLARFALLTLGWATAWLLVLIFFLTSTVETVMPYAFIALMVLYAHLTTILHCNYTKHRAMGQAVKDAFATGFGKILRFAHPYCYFFVLYVIVNQVQKLATGKATTPVIFLLFIAYMAWYRVSMRNILRHA